MKKLVSFGVAMLVSTVALCADNNKPWEKVRVTANPKIIEQCQYIGEVKGKSIAGGIFASEGERRAYSFLKKAAYVKGADVVLMTMGSSGHTGTRLRGEAYLCVESLLPKPTVEQTEGGE